MAFRIRSITLFFLLNALFISFKSFAGKEDHVVLRDAEASERIERATIVRLSYDREVPSFVLFREGEGIPAEDFKAWLKKRFDGLRSELVEVGRNRDRKGWEHVRYEQRVNGIPVIGGECIAHVRNGKVRSFNGILFSGLRDLPSTPAISEEEARKTALQRVGAKSYKWEHPGAENWLREFTGDPDTSYFPEGRLRIVPASGNIQKDEQRLAYSFNIYAHEPISRAEHYIDAVTGEQLYKDPIIKSVDDTGTAVTGYSGTRTIVADSTGPNSYRLRESGRGNGIETYDMNQGTDYNNAVDFIDSNNYWDNANAQKDEYAGDAHWGAEMTYDYLWQEHNRNSIDDQGFKLLSYVHYDQDYGNAFWDGQRMTYGDGSNGNNPLTALDICGHEITHGLTSQTADLVYQDEPGALNESFSDIFGNAIEQFAKPGNADWKMGEDIGALRDMADPKSFGDPDTYLGTDWYSGSNDNGGVHTNSGVQNYWFYLMVEGGSGTNSVGDSYNVTSVGWDTAAAIAYRNLVNYLGQGSEYADARFYAIRSAIDLYGACSKAHKTTANAWHAVNVGDPYNPNVVADLKVSKDSACNAPLTVDFTSQTANGTSFHWAFGNGDSASGPFPSYTYSDTGQYDVTLMVSGGCGSDTNTVDDKITISPKVPCKISMPTSGWGNTITSCTGTLFDSGGPNGNYPNQEDSYITISPQGASSVSLDFIDFSVEAGDASTAQDCDYDYVSVYDGTSTSDPLIGTYCNSGPPPNSVSSSGGSITIQLHSDQYVNRSGFRIDWTCTEPNAAPRADFYANKTNSCSGKIRFFEKTYQGVPQNYYWDFGDGDTSSAANPVHLYDQDGTYSVELRVSNSYGRDSTLKTDLITVDRPNPPMTTGDTICDEEKGQLIANAGNGNSIRWYESALSDSVIQTGDTLNTGNLNASKTYYAESVPASQKLGPSDNSFGPGKMFSYDQHLIFDCDTPSKLISVKVYADGGKDRTIELRDSSGTILEDTTIYIPDGEQRITLDFEIPVGEDHQLGVAQGPDLYRNESGASYPYSISNMLTIERSSASSAPYDYYYFFYDWEVRTPYCRPRGAAKLTVCPSIEEQNKELSLRLRPNPSRGRFLLEGSFLREGGELLITDSYGKQVRRIEEVSGNEMRIDLSEQAAGVYFLKMQNEEGTKVERLLIQR